MTGLGVRVRALREARGWSQRQLAHLAQVSKPTIADVEHERRGTTVHVAQALAAALGTTVGALLGEHPVDVVPRPRPQVAWHLIRAEVDALRAGWSA